MNATPTPDHPMTEGAGLQLDARQRAMLAEMGVSVWLPEARLPSVQAQDPAQAQARTPAQQSAVVAVPSSLPPVVAQEPQAAWAPTLPEPQQVAPQAPSDDEPHVQVQSPLNGVLARIVQNINGDSPILHGNLPETTHAGELARQGLDGLAPITHVDPAHVAQLDWPELQASVARCRACRLCESRRQTVFGVGAQRADWLVVGEAPGEQEDRRGEPFVGPAGQLLDAMLAAVGVSRQAPAGEQAVYIANVLKCRPPGNRNPAPDEVAQCEPYLRRQVALLQPKIILALGRFAVQSLLNTTEPIGRLRQHVHQYQGVPVIVSYHPAYLLRNLPDKSKAWADLVLAMKVAGRLEG